MRAMSVIGLLLIVFGIFALTYQGFTFFTTERAVDAGPLKIDWQKPHTVFLHPIVGVVSVIAGVACMMADRRAVRA